MSEREHIQPRKSLGQNFLTDRNIAQKIVAALECAPEDSLLEIGPGEGALTGFLLASPAREVLAVEFDSRAVEYLHKKFPAERRPGFSVHNQDFLRFPLRDYARQQREQGRALKVIGNIPYNITSPILFQLFDAAEYIERAVIMMQREVARRLVAPLRSKDYGILTVATAYHARAKILFNVAPGCFYPRPAVSSAVVAFNFAAAQRLAPERYARVKPLVNAAFGQRRKVLANALAALLQQQYPDCAATISEHAQAAGLDYFRKRAEELSPEDFMILADFLEQKGGTKDCGTRKPDPNGIDYEEA